MTTEMSTQKTGTDGRARSVVLLTLVLGAVLAALVALVLVTEREAQAASAEKIVFVSKRTTGKGVDNLTGDREIFRMTPNGTGVRQLTFNTGNDIEPNLSPDGQRIAYTSRGEQISNPEGDSEVYLMNALDGTEKKNLSNNGGGIGDVGPVFSPDVQKIAYYSVGIQNSNPEGDKEVYRMNVLDGLGKKNLSNNGSGILEELPAFSPDGTKIAYESSGAQTSNLEGDEEIYSMNALDGSSQINLTNNGSGVYDETPSWGRQSM